ncbi:MAG: DUF721 domain-containing protein [Candidatus Aegiribacteria sp.]|nr:DUF721 domain-containing protein [Candidatus Aegiribacteria sp.]
MKKIDSLIPDVLSDFRPDVHQKRNSVVMMWKDIVGEELAAFVRPVGIEESVLLLRVIHPAASMEILLRKREILLKLNSVWDEELFTDLKTV